MSHDSQAPAGRRRLLTLALGLPVLGVAGCATPILGTPAPMQDGNLVMADLRTYRLALTMGQIGEVRLPSNPSTGYRWALVEPSTGVLTLMDHGFSSASITMVGAPGEERWTFKAVRVGTGELRFEYRRPWEPADIAPAQRTRFEVQVR